MADRNLRPDGDLVASYAITVEGVQRTKKALADLDYQIELLRKTQYQSGSSVTARANTAGQKDVFTSKFAAVEGRVQTAVRDTMSKSMAQGKRLQATALRASVTPTGLSGASHVGGRKGPGREDSGHMINSLATNVETLRGADFTSYVGWHGWPANREDYIGYQEGGTKGRGGSSKASAKSTGELYRAPNAKRKRVAGTSRTTLGKGVPAVNSLGMTIPVVREHLKAELRKIR